MRTYIFFIIAIVALATFSSCGDKPEGSSAEKDKYGSKVIVGDRAPNFVVFNATDNLFQTSDLAGRKTLLLLFDIACPHCRNEFPIINQVWENLKDDPQCNVVTISRVTADNTREQDMETVLKWWSDHDFTMPIFFDNNRAAYNVFATAYIPRIYIIGSKGIIQWMKVGRSNLTADELTKLVKTI